MRVADGESTRRAKKGACSNGIPLFWERFDAEQKVQRIQAPHDADLLSVKGPYLYFDTFDKQ